MAGDAEAPSHDGSCPICRGEDIKRKLSARTVAILFGLLALDLFLLASTPHVSATQTHPVTTVLALGAGVLGLMAPLALLVALFAKNSCYSCGHKWR